MPDAAPRQPPPPTGARRALGLVLPVAAAVVALGVVASTLAFLWESRWAGPVTDFWLFVPKLAAHDAGDALWPIVWEPYGGHRLVFPKLLYIAEYRFFGGRNDFLLACNLVFQALTAALLVRFTWKEGDELSAAERFFLGAACVTLLFSATQLENFSRGWNVHHFMACFGSVAALLCLCRSAAAEAGAAWAWLVACGGAAAFGSFSMAIALPVWPVLLVAAWRLGLPRARLGALFALTGLALLLFFTGHRAAGDTTLEQRLADLPGLLLWAVSCLGSPLSWWPPGAGVLLPGQTSPFVKAAGALVVLSLLGVGAFAIARMLPGRRPRPLEVLYPGLVFVGAGGALLASYGRVVGYAQGWDAHRYQSFVLLFWLGVIGTGALASAGAGWRRGLRAVLALALVAWVGGVLLPWHLREGRRVREFAEEVRGAHDALLVGVDARKAYLASLPKILWRESKADVAAFSRPWLEEKELGMFAAGRQHRLGRHVGTDLETLDPSQCRGGVRNVRFVAGFPLLEGHVEGEAEILVSDDRSQVRGLGRTRSRRVRSQAGEALGFTAWLPRTPPGSLVEVWALAADGRLCRIAGPLQLERRAARPRPG